MKQRKESVRIPDLTKILKPTWLHEVGYRVNDSGWHKMKIFKQATNPIDPKILTKLGIKKKEKVLAIAGYYGNWASELNKRGAKVTYSDISKSMVAYVRKKVKPKFEEYICSNYELIPKKPKEYDWTFTFESCGGSQGLPIAYLRSLMNNKGGILVLYWNTENRKAMGGKPKRYPLIVKTLARIYGAKYEIKDINFRAYSGGTEIVTLLHKVYFLKTNSSAGKKAQFDLQLLDELKNKRKIKPKNKEEVASLRRLNRLTKTLNKDFIKDLEIK